MDNYIVINGKRAELTEEQLKQLGIKTSKNLWIRMPWFTREGKPCWGCPECGTVTSSLESSLEIFHIFCGACGNRNILEDI